MTLISCAVIEVVSCGYELKDIELGPPFYLANGVQYVIVFDPATQYVLHFRPSGVERFTLACKDCLALWLQGNGLESVGKGLPTYYSYNSIYTEAGQVRFRYHQQNQ